MLKQFVQMITGSKKKEAFYEPLKMIKDFSQGTVIVSDKVQDCRGNDVVGNCAVIALIKAALVNFQTTDKIFKKFEIKEDVIYCKFRDGTTVQLTKEEIDLTISLAGLNVISNSEYDHTAIVLYGLICKRVFRLKRKYSKKCIHSFQDAIEFVNCGYNTEEVYQLLALKKNKVSVEKLEKYPAVVIWNKVHASYCSYGIQDILGEEHKVKHGWMRNPLGAGGSIQGAYTLK